MDGTRWESVPHLYVRSIEPQYIASLGNPRATSGNGSQSWALEPGPGPARFCRERHRVGSPPAGVGPIAGLKKLPAAASDGTIQLMGAVNDLEAARARFRGACNILQTLPPERLEGSRFLDIGCGIGNMLLAASQAGAKRVVGTDIDLAEFGYNFLKEVAEDQRIRIDQIEMVERDFCEYESDELFDVITCFDVMEHVREPERFIQNIYRNTAQDGIVVIDSCPLYYSPLGHHLFSYFDRETMPWAHLYKDFDELIRQTPIDSWTWPLFQQLNKITANQLKKLATNVGFTITDEHGSRTGHDLFHQFKYRIRVEEVPDTDDLFHEWIRLYLKRG